MKVIIHDLGDGYDALLKEKCDSLIAADGKYAPCQGCFGCWTKHPAQCYMKDSLKEVCRTVYPYPHRDVRAGYVREHLPLR